MARKTDRIFKPPFSMTGAISQDRDRCQFLFCLMKNPLLYRSARPESGREARERFLMAPLARTQSERRRRLALASGFRLLRSSGIDRLDAPGTRRGAGRQAQMAEDFDDHRRIFDACPEPVEGAAMIFKAPPQFG